MKRLKRYLSLFLTLLMVGSLFIPAWAEDVAASESAVPDMIESFVEILKNGEYLIVSRSYANDFKTAIGMKGGNA